jgi:serine/threonine protein kinase
VPDKIVEDYPIEEHLREAGLVSRSEIQNMADFLRNCLAIDPAHRSTAARLLDHPWLNIE